MISNDIFLYCIQIIMYMKILFTDTLYMNIRNYIYKTIIKMILITRKSFKS